MFGNKLNKERLRRMEMLRDLYQNNFKLVEINFSFVSHIIYSILNSTFLGRTHLINETSSLSLNLFGFFSDNYL
jgi:hypothetical protein